MVSYAVVTMTKTVSSGRKCQSSIQLSFAWSRIVLPGVASVNAIFIIIFLQQSLPVVNRDRAKHVRWGGRKITAQPRRRRWR